MRGKAVIWQTSCASCSILTDVLVGTGAGGGKCGTDAYLKIVENTGRGGQSIVSPVGISLLRAANPRASGIPPLKLVGYCVFPLVFPPMDQSCAWQRE